MIVMIIFVFLLFLSSPSSILGQGQDYSFSGTFDLQPAYVPANIPSAGVCNAASGGTAYKYAHFSYTFVTPGVRRLAIMGSSVSMLHIYQSSSFDPSATCTPHPVELSKIVGAETPFDYDTAYYFQAATYTIVVVSSSSSSIPGDYFAGTLYNVGVVGDTNPSTTWTPYHYFYSCQDDTGSPPYPYAYHTFVSPATGFYDFIASYTTDNGPFSHAYLTVYSGVFSPSMVSTHACNAMYSYRLVGQTITIYSMAVTLGNPYTVILTTTSSGISHFRTWMIPSRRSFPHYAVSDPKFNEPNRAISTNATSCTAASSPYNNRPWASYIFNVVPNTWFYVAVNRVHDLAFFIYEGDNGGSTSLAPYTCINSSNLTAISFVTYVVNIDQWLYATSDTYTMVFTSYNPNAVVDDTYGADIFFVSGEEIASPTATTTSAAAATTAAIYAAVTSSTAASSATTTSANAAATSSTAAAAAFTTSMNALTSSTAVSADIATSTAAALEMATSTSAARDMATSTSAVSETTTTAASYSATTTAAAVESATTSAYDSAMTSTALQSATTTALDAVMTTTASSSSSSSTSLSSSDSTSYSTSTPELTSTSTASSSSSDYISYTSATTSLSSSTTSSPDSFSFSGTTTTTVTPSSTSTSTSSGGPTPSTYYITSVSSTSTRGGDVAIEGVFPGGSNFVTSLFIGPFACPLVNISSSSLLFCRVVPGTGHNIPLVLTLSSSPSDVLVSSFNYLPPTISSFSNITIYGGPITISGDNFGNMSSIIRFEVNHQNCTSIRRVSHTSFVCTLPSFSSSGLYNYTFTVDGQSSPSPSPSSSISSLFLSPFLPPVLVLPFNKDRTYLRTTESGGADKMTIVLTRTPSSGVTIQLSVSHKQQQQQQLMANEGPTILSDTELRFTPSNWNVPQIVDIKGGVDSNVVQNSALYVDYSLFVASRSSSNDDPSFDYTVDMTIRNFIVAWPFISYAEPSTAPRAGLAVTVYGGNFLSSIPNITLTTTRTTRTASSTNNSEKKKRDILFGSEDDWNSSEDTYEEYLANPRGITVYLSGVVITNFTILSNSLLRFYLPALPSVAALPLYRTLTLHAKDGNVSATCPFNADLLPLSIGASLPQCLPIDFIYYTDSMCEAGTYGRLGETCLACPEGGLCPGGERIWALPGYWNPNEHTPPTACSPPEACPGYPNMTTIPICNSGYMGDYCSLCEDGFYRLTGYCESCSGDQEGADTEGLFIIFAAIVFFGAIALGIFFLNDDTLDAYVGKLLTLQQLISIGQGVSEKFPLWARKIFNLLNLVQFDYSFSRTECILGPINLPEIFAGYIVMALAFLVVFVLVSILRSFVYFSPYIRLYDKFKQRYDMLVIKCTPSASTTTTTTIISFSSKSSTTSLQAIELSPIATQYLVLSSPPSLPSLSPTLSPSSSKSSSIHESEPSSDYFPSSTTPSSDPVPPPATLSPSKNDDAIPSDNFTSLEEDIAAPTVVNEPPEPVFSGLNRISRFFLTSFINTDDEAQKEEMTQTWTRLAYMRVSHAVILLASILHYVITLRTLQILYCVNIPTDQRNVMSSRLYWQLGVGCYSSRHLIMGPIGWCVLLVYVIGFPLVCTYLIYKSYKAGFNVQQRLQLSFLVGGLKPNGFWYGVVSMLLTIVVAVQTAFEMSSGSVVFTNGIIFLAIWIACTIRFPFEGRLDNFKAIVNGGVSQSYLVVLFGASVWPLNETISTQDGIFFVVILVCTTLSFIVVLPFAVLKLRRQLATMRKDDDPSSSSNNNNNNKGVMGKLFYETKMSAIEWVPGWFKKRFFKNFWKRHEPAE